MSDKQSRPDNPAEASLNKLTFDEVNLGTPPVYTSKSSPMSQVNNAAVPIPPDSGQASADQKQPSVPQNEQDGASIDAPVVQPPVYTAVYPPGKGPFQPFGTYPQKTAFVVKTDACPGTTYYVQGNGANPAPVIIVTPYSRIRLLNWAIFSILLIFLPILIFWLIILSFD